MKAKDTIIKMNQQTVTGWRDIAMPLIIQKGLGGNIQMSVKRAGRIVQLKPSDLSDLSLQHQRGLLAAFGIKPMREHWPATITAVKAKSSAASAGLKAGDTIISIDQDQINNAEDLLTFIQENPGRKVNISLKRQGKIQKIRLQIASKGTITAKGYIGIQIAEVVRDARLYGYAQYGPIPGLINALSDTWDYLRLQTATLALMISGDVTLKAIGGPVVIIAQTLNIISLQSLVMLMNWIAIINISLAFINVLPIPIFDGGRILLISIEALRGKPLKQSTQSNIEGITFALLLGLFATITYNDIARILGLIQ